MDSRFILVFTVRNEAGALARAVDVVGRYGFNMHALRSRPMKDLLWEYYFYLEAEGDIRTREGEDMMRALSVFCDRLKLVGSYTIS
jgi:chorismate mutase/prephenate dehydratase